MNLSDVNHELGKAKESLVYESGSYIDNFKSDAALVGSLIRYYKLVPPTTPYYHILVRSFLLDSIVF